ncbi:hypothetical protein NXS98_09430 [Fontisphaera persica]|uniref:GH39 family glycosyl hydrolase n=1 Tax=Fontisphaera persica TaxID=2974023 RepID=UPI0024C09901|nr:hypothetical protein [Fontisphaera persica]WCJ57950.1 hypothetical protein NXS98_09430 [Fontisphaera persica]
MRASFLRSGWRRCAWQGGLLLAVLVGAGLATPAGGAVGVIVEASRTNGVIRPVHGVNLGPLCYRGMVDLTAHHRELGVPYTRVHDVVWVNAYAVDVSTIFRDFRQNPQDPASYDFACTDDYLAAITNAGSRIIYRLGESIEHTPRKYRVHPPPEPRRWAEICLGIIRHYNEGWAQGFRHGIEYWEIWNEPDVRPAMWTGTDAQFFELYETTARAIKREFPRLKVGGPGLGGTGDFVDGQFRPTAFATNFLAYCRARQAPLDFLSWHRYTSDPWDIPRRAAAMRRLLDDYGFRDTESHFNEWNYLPREDWRPMFKEGQGPEREAWFREMSGPAGAAFAACVLTHLQEAPVEVANFYTGEIQGFGLFNFHGTPQKNYYAFLAFRRMLDTPERVVTEGAPQGMTVLAGRHFARKELQVLFANFRQPERELAVHLRGLPWETETEWEWRVVDEQSNLDRRAQGRLGGGGDARITLSLPMPGVGWLRLKGR